MQKYIDKNTHKIFYILPDDNLDYNYPLVNWAREFLNIDKNFLDIGSSYGYFSLTYASECKNVYAYETNKEIHDCLCYAISENNCFNIKTYFDDAFFNQNLENIHFVHIAHCTIAIVNNLHRMLNDNFYPTILYCTKDNNVNDLLKEFGYKVTPVSGTVNYYLAAENELYTRNQKLELSRLIEKYINNKNDKYSISEYKSIVAHYRNLGEYDKCYDIIQIVKDKREFLEELAIICYYLNKLDEGYQACEDVVFSKTIAWGNKNVTFKNQFFYMNKLSKMVEISNVIEIPRTSNVYCPSSSSIYNDDGNLKLNVRMVNYSIDSNGGYHIRDIDNYVRTKNYFYDMDDDGNLTNRRKLTMSENINLTKYPKNIVGLEDLRLFDKNEFFCTSSEYNELTKPQMCYGRFDDNGIITELVPLKIGEEINCEKNWLPFKMNDKLYFIYSFESLRIYEYDEGKIKLYKEYTIDSKYDYSIFRGSAAPIRYKNGWLMTIHQVYYNSPRYYAHRFVYFDEYFENMKISKVFYFESFGIEYSLSMAIKDDKLYIPYSIKDNSSKIIIMDVDELNTLLNF